MSKTVVQKPISQQKCDIITVIGPVNTDLQVMENGKQNHKVHQDLHNIKKQYNIDGVIRHKNDLTSVTAWVEEMKTLPYSPILRFKQQGFKQSDHLDNIADNDLFLCMQNEFQRDMCEKLRGNAVCIDSTHGTNTYDFKLITMLVVDEYGKGVPVGWLISDREDAIC